jgi:hypothetical protein
MDRKALLIAVVAGAALQLALVVVGHFVVFVADNLFAIGGTLISAAAGALYARRAPRGAAPLQGGMAAGVACAVIGIAVSVLLGDVPWIILVFGALAGLIAGAVGAAAARALAGRGGPGEAQG